MVPTRLRVPFGFLAVLALGALASAPPASADAEQLRAAFDDYAAGRHEEALTKLREYVQTNPGNDEVYAVLKQVDERVKIRALAQGGEHERLMRYLLEKARPVVDEQKRDPETIARLVEEAIDGEADVRRRAGMQLAGSAGDYAVPALLPHLASADAEKVVNAIFALQYIGSEAVPPLSEAMSSDDARLRAYVAVVLGDIRDPRAIPVLLRAAQKDPDENVRAKAVAALQKIRPTGPAQGSAADSFVRVGERYLSGDPMAVAELDEVYSVWQWQDGNLVRHEVPKAFYGYHQAELHAAKALEVQPNHRGARSLLVRSILAQKVEGTLLGEQAPEALAGATDLAAAQGFEAASDALADAMAMRQWDIATEAAGVVRMTYDRRPLQGHPLGRALTAPDRRLRYAAAVAALRMSPPGPFENSQEVPALAAQAASEVALRQVLVIDDRDQARGRMLVDLRQAGYLVADDADGFRGVARAKAMPALDVVVVRADLGDPANTLPSYRYKSSLSVIDELMADARTRNAKIVVVASGETPERLEATKAFLTQKYGDKIAGFVEEPLVASAYLPTIESAVGAIEDGPQRTRALALAADAAAAFADANTACTAWNFQVAVEPLSTGAAEGPSPEIRLNAARALGNLRAGGGPGLAAALKDAEAPEELKVAAARALGLVLSKNPPQADEIDVLVATAKAGGAVGAEALRALGMAKTPPEAALTVYRDHRLDIYRKAE
jgi:HEAT repeat protein